MLRETGTPVAFLRADWLMEIAAWDVPSAREGRIDSYLQPLDRVIEMVSVHGIGRTAVDLPREEWIGTHTV